MGRCWGNGNSDTSLIGAQSSITTLEGNLQCLLKQNTLLPGKHENMSTRKFTAILLKMKNWRCRNVHQREDGLNAVSTSDGTLLSRRNEWTHRSTCTWIDVKRRQNTKIIHLLWHHLYKKVIRITPVSLGLWKLPLIPGKTFCISSLSSSLSPSSPFFLLSFLSPFLHRPSLPSCDMLALCWQVLEIRPRPQVVIPALQSIPPWACP